MRNYPRIREYDGRPFPPHVQLKLGDEVPVAVDTKNLHFFDEASGAPLR